MKGGRAPSFWWQASGWQAALLAPAAFLYGSVAGRRLESGRGARVDLPVLCVGNFTAGGAGKTPTALALARAAQAIGLRPTFLTRGHGGRERGPLRVDPAVHNAADVGDEPLLLAEVAPTVVARDRAAGAHALVEAGFADIVLMDDGFQSARLQTDLSLLVVDGRRGLGNARVLPAGPLRAPLPVQMARAGAVLVVGPGRAGDEAARLASEAGVPVHRARLAPIEADTLLGRPLLAFAGIADPDKFYGSLREIGAELAATRDFPDHHAFTPAEIDELARLCDARGLTPATTEKDAVRLRASGSGSGRALLARAAILSIEMRFEDGDAQALLHRALDAFERRRD